VAVINDDAGGERREIGRTATVGFRSRNRLEAVIRRGRKPRRGAERRGSGRAAERESGNGLPVLIVLMRRKRREEGSWGPNGSEGNSVGRLKESAGSIDPVDTAWKRVAIAGERKADPRHRLLPGRLADVLRSGEPQASKAPEGSEGESVRQSWMPSSDRACRSESTLSHPNVEEKKKAT
jgi:hypothetical protein